MRLGARGFAIAVAAFVLLAAAVVGYYVASANEGRQETRAMRAPFGDVGEGRDAIRAYGCAACHAISGIRAPGGRVGPDLRDVHRRRFLAGEIPNTPENLARWVMAPQAVRPGSAMPNLGVTREDAEDIVAYLYGAGERP